LHTVVGAILLVGCCLVYLGCRRWIEDESGERAALPGMVTAA
jgi:hypothetical protein